MSDSPQMFLWRVWYQIKSDYFLPQKSGAGLHGIQHLEQLTMAIFGITKMKVHMTNITFPLSSQKEYDKFVGWILMNMHLTISTPLLKLLHHGE